MLNDFKSAIKNIEKIFIINQRGKIILLINFNILSKAKILRI